jgi:hypothetical protein
MRGVSSASVDGTLPLSGAAMMICDRRTFLALTSSVAFAGSAFAAEKHNHHDGAKMLGEKINTDGKHELHKGTAHTVFVHVRGKKIAGVTATHKTKGELPIKKYKSSKKMVQGDGFNQMAVEGDGGLVQRVDFRVAQAPGDIVSVGYAVTDPETGITEIYWYLATMVIDPLTGAVDYVPV